MRLLFGIVCLLIWSGTTHAMMDIKNSSTTIGGGLFKPSTNVRITASSTNATYSAIAGHDQGDHEFGTRHENTRMFSREKAKGTPASNCDSADYIFTSWTSQ